MTILSVHEIIELWKQKLSTKLRRPAITWAVFHALMLCKACASIWCTFLAQVRESIICGHPHECECECISISSADENQYRGLLGFTYQ